MTEDLKKIVDDTYKNFRENNQKANFKFTDPMLTMLRGNIYENYIDDYLNMFKEYNEDELTDELINTLKDEMIARIDSNPRTSEITRYYMDKCREKIGDFDPMKVKENLIKLNLL